MIIRVKESPKPLPLSPTAKIFEHTQPAPKQFSGIASAKYRKKRAGFFCSRCGQRTPALRSTPRGRDICKHCDREDIPYTFKVVRKLGD